MKLDWDDLRYFLAVIEHGSTKRAAAALRVDQTTCARRIGALEGSLGLELFARDSGRYVPTQDALQLVEAAKAMDAAVGTFREQADGRRRARCRKIRVTGDEALAPAIIAPAVARFAQSHPDVQVEIDISREVRDLSAGEADIALRGGLEPTDPRLIRRKLADDVYGVYCNWSYPSPPRSRAEMPGHPIACLDVTLARVEAAGLGQWVKHVVNSIGALRAIIGEGNVVGGLPAIIGDAPPPLRLCFPVDAPTAIWVVYPERLRRVPEIKELGRLLAEEFRRSRTDTAVTPPQ